MSEIALEHAADANGRKLLWTFGANDQIEDLPADRLKEFKPTGSFRADFVALSAKCGIPTHPGFVPPVRPAVRFAAKSASHENASEKGGKDAKEGSVLSLQSVLVGRAAMLVFRNVIPAALHLEVLRLTSCCLDIDCLGLLRAGLTEACSVAILQLDWNPLELPIDAAALKAAVQAGQVEEIDKLEQELEQQQAQRNLHAFKGVLASRFGDVPSALKELGVAATKNCEELEATACFEPFAFPAWADAFRIVLNADADEAEKIFSIVNGPLYGTGDGVASFRSLEKIFEGLPEPATQDEAADPIGRAFAAFADATSPLDVFSLRHCGLSRLEMVAMGRALSQTQHLRGINLWGSNICDAGVAYLAESLDANPCLQFLGLGRNSVTHVGLEKLCSVLGYQRIDEKAKADQIMKDIKDKAKAREAWMKGLKAPKKDVHGIDRYTPEAGLPTCSLQTDAVGDFWLWGRNMTLKTLNLEHNPISDAAAVMKIQPFGVGAIHMKGVPCAVELLQLFTEATASRQADTAGEAENVEAPKPYGPGWSLIFQ